MHMWPLKLCCLTGCRHSGRKYGKRRASQKRTGKNYLGPIGTKKDQAQSFLSCLDRLRAKWANMERYFWRALDKVEEERRRDQKKHFLQYLWKVVILCSYRMHRTRWLIYYCWNHTIRWPESPSSDSESQRQRNMRPL